MLLSLIANLFLSKITIALIDLSALLLAFLVFQSNAKKNLVQIYLAMTFAMLSWVNFAYIPRFITQANPELSLILLKIAWFATPLFFYFLYLLLVYLLNKPKEYQKLTNIVFDISIISAIITGLTNKVVAGLNIEEDVASITYGDFKILFLFLVFLIVIATLIPIFKDKAFKNKSLQHFLAGLIIFYIANSIFNILLPMFLGIAKFYFLGDYSTLILLGLTAYGMVQHQMFNIKVFLVEVLMIAIWISICLILFVSESVGQFVLGCFVLFLTVIFGVILIRNIKGEIKQKEKLEKINEKLKDLDKAKSVFLSVASHQLRTPLTVIKGYSSMILEGDYGKINKEVKKTTENIFISSNRLIDVVENFLDTTRIDLGRMHYDFKEVDLRKMCEGVLQEFIIKAQEKSLDFKYKLDNKKMLVMADETKIRQVLVNLVDNAIKYTEAGFVDVSMHVIGDKILFCVRDSGMGIAKNEIGKLFKQFARTDNAIKSHVNGTGLGLYVARQIMKAHDGRIWIESEGLGKGSQFYFELPLKK